MRPPVLRPPGRSTRAAFWGEGQRGAQCMPDSFPNGHHTQNGGRNCLACESSTSPLPKSKVGFECSLAQPPRAGRPEYLAGTSIHAVCNSCQRRRPAWLLPTGCCLLNAHAAGPRPVHGCRRCHPRLPLAAPTAGTSVLRYLLPACCLPVFLSHGRLLDCSAWW